MDELQKVPSKRCDYVRLKDYFTGICFKKKKLTQTQKPVVSGICQKQDSRISEIIMLVVLL